MRIAAAKCRLRQALRRRAVAINLLRRKTFLPARLIAETVDEIFGWKLIRGVGLIAQQIAHRVVVLAVGQTPEFRVLRHFAATLVFQIFVFQCGCQFRARRASRQVIDPPGEQHFFRAAGPNPLPPVCGMRFVGFAQQLAI